MSQQQNANVKYKTVTQPPRGYIATNQGIHWENKQTRMDHPSVSVIDGPYQQVIVNLSGEPEFHSKRWQEYVETSYLPFQKKAGELLFGLNIAEPFGTFGREVLVIPTKNFMLRKMLPLLPAGAIIHHQVDSPNLARLAGLCNRYLVQVDDPQLFQGTNWFSVSELEKLLEQKEIRCSTTFAIAAFALADPFGLLIGNIWQPKIDVAAFSRKIQQLQALATPEGYFQSQVIAPQKDENNNIINQGNVTTWQVEDTRVYRPDGKFFSVQMMESPSGIIFPGLLEESGQYNGNNAEKIVGGVYCPVKLIKTNENDPGQIMVGLFPWNRPGLGGQMTPIVPRWSNSSGEAQGQTQQKIIFSKLLHTYEWLLTGTVQAQVIGIDPKSEYLDNQGRGVIWFSLDEALVLSYQILDPLTKSMLYWVCGHQDQILETLK